MPLLELIPKELLKQIRRIEITTTRLVNDLFGGEYESVFKGQGIEFADVREYVPGDDIRTIDWNVTARSQRPFVKQFVEERELTVLFVVDASASCYFGSASKLKSEVITEICALLAFAAVKNNDKVGLTIFTDRVEKSIPPKKGRKHVLRVIRETLYFHPQKKATDFTEVLEFLNRVLTRRAVIFFVSDFIGIEDSHALRILSKKHDLIAIGISDPRERSLPATGLIELEDAETDQILMVDTSNKRVRDEYKSLTDEQFLKIERLFKTLGIDQIQIDTSQSYVEPIVRFFKLREQRL